MKKTILISLMTVALASTAAHAGDPVAGKQKAAACAVCHGNETFGGIFYTLQLAGRDADKLAIKTNKYKTGKILHPMMNVATAFFTEKEIEDITAYYKSLGKPALNVPFVKIKGDDDVDTGVTAGAPAGPIGNVASRY
jgi:cytochrome c553